MVEIFNIQDLRIGNNRYTYLTLSILGLINLSLYILILNRALRFEKLCALVVSQLNRFFQVWLVCRKDCNNRCSFILFWNLNFSSRIIVNNSNVASFLYMQKHTATSRSYKKNVFFLQFLKNLFLLFDIDNRKGQLINESRQLLIFSNT